MAATFLTAAQVCGRNLIEVIRRQLHTRLRVARQRLICPRIGRAARAELQHRSYMDGAPRGLYWALPADTAPKALSP